MAKLTKPISLQISKNAPEIHYEIKNTDVKIKNLC